METGQLLNILAGLGLLLIPSVFGLEKKLKCNPANDLENYSSREATGVIYGVAEEKVNTAKNASILCYSKSKPEIRFITELVVFGEPPKAVYLDLNIAVLSQLYNTTIFCCLHDIESINRSPYPEEKDYYKEISGSVTYKCDDKQLQLSLELAGIELLREDFREVSAEQSPSRPRRYDQSQKNEDIERNNENCVKIGNKPQGQDRDNLEDLCDCSSGTCRLMFNEKQELVCSLCCANHYYSLRSRKCEECGGCYTNQKSSVRTSCIYDHNCKRPTTPDDLSTINKKPHTSTTIPTSTTSTTISTSSTSETFSTSTTATTSTASTTATASITGKTTTISETAKNDESGRINGLVAVIVVLVVVLVFVLFVILYCVFCKSRLPYTHGNACNIVH